MSDVVINKTSISSRYYLLFIAAALALQAFSVVVNPDSKNMLLDFCFFSLLDILLFLIMRGASFWKIVGKKLYLVFILSSSLACFYLTFGYLLPLGGDSINTPNAVGFFDAAGYESTADELASNGFDSGMDVGQNISYYLSIVYSIVGKNAYCYSLINSFLLVVSIYYFIETLLLLGFAADKLRFVPLIAFFPEIGFYGSMPGKEGVSIFLFTISACLFIKLLLRKRLGPLDVVLTILVAIFTPVRIWIPFFGIAAAFFAYTWLDHRRRLIFFSVLAMSAFFLIFYQEIVAAYTILVEFSQYIDTELAATDPLKSQIRGLLRLEYFWLLPVLLSGKVLLYFAANYPIPPRYLDVSFLVGNADVWILFHQVSLYVTGLFFCATGVCLFQLRKTLFDNRNVIIIFHVVIFGMLLFAIGGFYIHIRYRYPVLVFGLGLGIYINAHAPKKFLVNLLCLSIVGFVIAVSLLFL